MKEPSPFEGGPKIELSYLCEKIRERGLNDPEVKDLIGQWCDGEQAMVDANPTVEARVEFEIRRAEIGRAARDLEGAVRTLEDALTVAEEEGHGELCARISEMLKELEGINEF